MSNEQRYLAQKKQVRANHHVRRSSTKKEDSLLVPHLPPKDKEIVDLIKKIKSKYSDNHVVKILVHNKYEKLVPFNLWFRHPLYKVINNYQCGQYMRARYYNSLIVTPLVSSENNNLGQIKQLLPSLSLYQPFYPETFYAIWEILRMGLLGTNISKFLYIGKEERLGSIEALIFYHEKYQQTYQYNIYHCWLAGREIYCPTDGSFGTMVPKTNYLAQAYKLGFINSTNELIKYHFISIDTIHIFSSMFEWENEELDLQAMFFYILTSLKQLEDNGSMLVRLNMVGSRSWSYLFHILYQYFKEYTFIRPTVLHPFNSEIYLFLDKFEYNPSIDSLTNQLLKNLYKQHTYECLHINLNANDQNPILVNFLDKTKEWIKQAENVMQSKEKDGATIVAFATDRLSEWHQTHDMKQIKELLNDFDDKSVQSTLKTTAKTFKVKPTLPKTLYTLSFYQKLIQKRAELNYYKRVMDTKPSQIFSNSRYNNQSNYLLTWEQLTSQIDVYQNLKYILKKEYHAEMVTNAWIKMYEMITMFPNLLPTSINVKTFHLCEAPGAFIASINHLLTTRNQNLEWYAQTLKPDNNSLALEDHFGLIALYPDRWLFGEGQGDKNDNSGDITRSTIIKYYANHPLLKNLDFMTADAGLQCHPTELNEQEAFLGKINMGQIICILACLPVGKSAIFKTFLPMSEPLTISMVYLLTHLFDLINIVKPSTSHSTNSEVYIVLNGYKGVDPELLEILYDLLDDPKITSKTLLFSQIDKTFFKTYTDTAISLMERQISSLRRNYYYYYHLDEIEKFQETIKDRLEEWLRTHIIFVLEKPLLNK